MKARIGPKMKKCLDFARAYTDCGGWHTFNPERATREPIARLEKLGLVETNQFGMYRTVKDR